MPWGAVNVSRHTGSKPANESMKSKIILLASHVEKGEGKEESVNFIIYHWMNQIAKIYGCFSLLKHSLPALTAFDQDAEVPGTTSYHYFHENKHFNRVPLHTIPTLQSIQLIFTVTIFTEQLSH